MNAKVQNQINEMKKQTIGVEIEMANITRENAIRTIAAYFHTEDTVTHKGGSYDAWTCTQFALRAKRYNSGRTWTITRDVSIRANSDAEKAEQEISEAFSGHVPILTYADIEDLQEVARQLRHNGAISNPKHGCGVHIHIGANGHTPQTLRNLANIMASHETLIASALNLDGFRMRRFCRTVDPDFLNVLNNKKPTTMPQLADIWYGTQGASFGRNQHYNDSRYHMLNLHATFTKGTILSEQIFYPKIL